MPIYKHSLRRRLAAAMFALMGVLGSGFAWMAYHEFKAALRLAGTDRLEAAARQVADLLNQSATARVLETTRLARSAEVGAANFTGAQRVAGETPAPIQAFLARNPLSTVWIYGEDGQSLARFGAEAADDDGAAAPVLPPAVSALRLGAGRVWYDTTVPIESPRTDGPRRFLSIRRPLRSSQTADLIERVIGSGAILKFGNAEGEVWTDLSVPTTAPSFAAPDVPATFTSDTGEEWIGIAVTVPDTPWLLWVSAAEHTMLAPAQSLVRRMVPITLVLMALGAVAVYGVSGRITGSVETMVRAAEDVAAGDYSRRVTAERDDEIGRLGKAFNVMAAHVEASHESLERRVAERTSELEQAREELDRFFGLSLDLLCIADIDGRFRRVNPAWEQVVGWAPEHLTAARYLDFTHPDDREATAAAAATLAGASNTADFENRFRCKDGSYRWLSWKAVSLPSEELLYAVARDVTDQRALDQARHRHASDLEEANRELEAFSYSVSHDLRAPLRHIAGFAALLGKHAAERLDDQSRRYITTISGAAAHMGQLVDDLLAFSRMARTEMLRGEVNLAYVVEAAVEEVNRESSGRQIAWKIGVLPVVVGDMSMLRLAITNLVHNANKYTRHCERAEIEIGMVPQTEGEQVLYVRDNGAGFDMAYADKLFGVFQRLHRAEEFEGTGIGLATVRRIIHRHGGRTWAEGTVGAGATFYVALPAREGVGA